MVLTNEEVIVLVTLLKKLEPGFFPLPIFEQFTRLNTTVTLDLVPIKTVDKKLHLGILKREKNDLWWPNRWLLAGTVLRSTDTEKTALDRLMQNELVLESSDAPIFRGVCLHKSKRGAEITLIYTLENTRFKNSSKTKWYSVKELPKSFEQSEKDIVKKIIDSVQVNNKKSLSTSFE